MGYSGKLIISIAVSIGWLFRKKFAKTKTHNQGLLIKQEEFKIISENVDAMLWKNDIINQKVYVSKGIEKISGYSVKEFEKNYFLWVEEVTHPDDQEIAMAFFQELLAGEQKQEEWRIINKIDKKIVWVQLRGTPIFDKKSNVIEIAGIVIDITKQKSAEAKLKESESRYKSVVELSPSLIAIHQNEKVVYANPASAKIIGISNVSDLIGKEIFDFIDPLEKEIVLKKNKEVFENKRSTEFVEYKVVRPNGKHIYVEMLGSKIFYNGKPAIMVVGNDVTSKRDYQEKIKFMAYNDPLTGLPNRYMLNEHLQNALARHKRRKKKLAVLFLDLDRFKFVNDTMGHQVGDILLK